MEWVDIQRTELSSDRHRLTLNGRLGPGWAGGFSRGLAECGLNIERGFAARNARGSWAAEFEVRATANALDPARIDYAGLLAAPPLRGLLAPIRLHRYALNRPLGERRLFLHVEAPDQLGFLAQLLGQLAFFSLFPVEMRVETQHGLVRDVIHLRSVAGGLPSDSVLEELRRELDGLLRQTAAARG